MSSPEVCDVAVVGGGPAGSMIGTCLRKYAPQLRVVILERERFPRDHVGESLLPAACAVLNRAGCWDKVEAAGFPVKIGATYRWGSSHDLWDFDFLNGQPYQDAPRPAKYEGQRQMSAFQVDRSIFDQLLLDHASDVGCDVRQQARVSEVKRERNRVTGLKLNDGREITGRYYIDASGHSGLIRRAMGIEIQEPSALKNIAIWRYWNNADWAVTVGRSGTRVQVLSLGWGWVWIIPITPTRTSIGLVLPAEYYRRSGHTPSDLYSTALNDEPNVATLLANAHPEERVFTTKDWSFIANRLSGDNWFLVGEAAGFADPILAAGISLAMAGAEEAAITIAELERGKHDPRWLRSEYERYQVQRLRTHIAFADYWYTSNKHFTELIKYAGTLADHAGLPHRSQDAWQWLGTGGFVQSGGAGIAGFKLAGASWLFQEFEQEPPEWNIARNNVFRLNLDGAERTETAIYHEGFIERVPGLKRNNRVLPARGVYRYLAQALAHSDRLDDVLAPIRTDTKQDQAAIKRAVADILEALEAMIVDGWVTAGYVADRDVPSLSTLMARTYLRRNSDNKVRF